nr:MAG TPA: hypothetical protein [Crassvirales sp.]
MSSFNFSGFIVIISVALSFFCCLRIFYRNSVFI